MATARDLLSAAAVRDRAHLLYELGIEGELEHFDVRLDRLPKAADFVLATMREAYPELDIPYHSRWRHFEAGDVNRWGGLVDASGLAEDPLRFGRAAYDLAIVSVLLDAGAGPDWRYEEAATGGTYARSEGLAVASFAMFASGLFSADPADPLRSDASALAALTADELAAGLQVTPSNPIVGLEGRVALLNALGRTVAERPDLFGEDEARPGGLFDACVAAAGEGSIAAPAVLDLVLDGLGAIWPGRILIDGVRLGDTWRHTKLVTDDATNHLVPFHKLSQWLTYSLLEPLLWTGVAVEDVDGLTGLPEYRNGGLFIDMGVLVPRRRDALTRTWHVDDEFIVEWRALTVALLDHTADMIRERLGVDRVALPLAKVLQGGTWAAGRAIAAEKRPGGAPPLTIASDGTVF